MPRKNDAENSIEYLLNFSQASQKISTLLASGVPVQELLDKILNIIPEALAVRQMALLYWYPNLKKFRLASVSVSALSTKAIETAMGKKLNELYYPADDPNNVFVRSVLNKSIEIEPSIEGSLIPVIDKRLAKLVSSIAEKQFKVVVSIPLIFKDNVYGVLAIGWEDEDFSEINRQIFSTFANQAAIAIYNSQLFSQSQNQIVSLENQNRDLASLFNLTSNVSKSLDPYQVGQIAVNSIPSGDMIGGMALTIYNPKTDDLVVAAINHNRVYDQVSKFTGRMEGLRINNKDPDTQQNPGIVAFNTKQEYFSDNVGLSMSPPLPKRFVGPILKLAPVKSSYNIPIKVRGEIVGVISFYLKTKTRQELTDNFIQLLRTYANQIGIALDNAYLFSKSQKTQRNLEKAIKDLQEARRKEKDMIDVMGHELRTPISIVRNSLMVLEADSKKNGTIAPDKLGKYLDMAIESTKREIRLIETLLSTAKLEGKRIQLNLTQISMNDVIKDSVEGNRSQLETKNLELRLNIPQDVPVYADRTRVQEIMDNLLSNALKYTAQGSVTISLYEEGDFARVEVSDTGVGISPEDLNKLGKKFFRAQTSFSGDFKGVKPGGTGLGLYVTFELIRVMGGQHHIQSTKGQGSTFSFNLPLYKGQPDQHIDQTFMNE